MLRLVARIVGGDTIAVPSPYDSLTQRDLARCLVALRDSRKAVKRMLYNMGLPATSSDVDLLLQFIDARSDRQSIHNLADSIDPRWQTVRESFDPMADLRDHLAKHGESVQEAATRIGNAINMPLADVSSIITGAVDPPLSVASKILAAARATRVVFPTRG